MSFYSMRMISGIKALPGIALLLVCALNVQLAHGESAYGRFSPSLFSVDERSDSILLLDVAGYLNPWYWTRVEHLYQAMNTRDGDNYRGYLVVRDGLSE